MYNFETEGKNNSADKDKNMGGHRGGRQDSRQDSGRDRQSGKGTYSQTQKGGGGSMTDDQRRNDDKKFEIKFNDTQIKYRDMLKSLNGSMKANLLNDKGAVLKSVLVRDLADTLKSAPKDTIAVVFDGTISQRLVDIAGSNNIKDLVAMKIGNVTKQPDNVELITKPDLE